MADWTDKLPPAVSGELDPPLYELYGCGTNPAGSMSVVSGGPVSGTTFVVGIDNPLGSQPAPAIAVLAISLAPDPQLRAGGYARATFTRTGAPMPAVQEKAVQWEASGPRLIAIDDNNRAHPVAVRTGPRGDGYVTLEQGPAVGTRVALGTGVALLEGDRVNPVEAGQMLAVDAAEPRQ